MSLQSQLDFVCNELQNVRSGDMDGDVAVYRVVALVGVNRISMGRSSTCLLKWHWATPPCQFVLSFYEVAPGFIADVALMQVFGICYNCNDLPPRLGTNHSFRTFELRIQNMEGHPIAVSQVHVQRGNDNADSIIFVQNGF